MSLDRLDHLLSLAPDVPGAFQSAEQRRTELRADVFAVAKANGGRFDLRAVQNRPSILRRVAGLLAETLPTGTDRLVCAQPDGIAVTTAIALHTGLPFTTVAGGGDQGAHLDGEAHAGEHAVVIAPAVSTGLHAAQLVAAAQDSGLRVTHVLSILDRAGNGAAGEAVARKGAQLHALFTADCP
ncbi:hypothetical protein AB0P36_31495 [Streptomyces flavidovirens]|uniref:hypothetical protein n=1 Tax=Streptomyces flavidovirens TaxID=67298 RepID=UPI00342FD6A1